MFDATPLSSDCARLYPEVSHACVGVSPFNGYFTADRLVRLAAWTAEHFEHFHFFIPDEVTAYTLEALGYPPARARQKAHRQSCHLHNKIGAALSALGVPDPGSRILGMARLRELPGYRRLAREVEHRFETDLEFRSACYGASTWVLQDKAGALPDEGRIRLAVRYFLAELPLFAGSGLITGHPRSMFVYHQRVPFLQQFFDRQLGFRPEPGQGFLVVREAALEVSGR
ncbi:tRNA-dependent cyclodipeptide synthase [Amycolatopsis sp. PS_44_ISF1]|uniref:tRNA-dependent cyclodipeptide synthase n=1 Tax=Amycolatopsis sp. PS_44_ISF1 TaxID=2974917 RepID=UPI0028DE9637|nr:tRNA-dependent cyclodipeptide synthase [Amycolatopsis sp. PS_44_ISF1]MDT8914761.1 tRNA-dependent cyclodipeptide synthase [Amycolatopsis sp. PS_44_ISF1]